MGFSNGVGNGLGTGCGCLLFIVGVAVLWFVLSVATCGTIVATAS